VATFENNLSAASRRLRVSTPSADKELPSTW